MRKISFTIFLTIIISYLVIVLNNIFILKNKNRKILFDNINFILYFLLLLIKSCFLTIFIYFDVKMVI